MKQSSKIIGVDLAKNVFQIALANSNHVVQQHKRLNRTQFRTLFINHPPVHIVMETCGTAHYWARTLMAMGHTVTLIPAQYVKPYVRRNKTDRNDAIALKTTRESLEMLPAVLQITVNDVLTELTDIQQRITTLEKQLKKIVNDDPVIQKFMQLNGIGLLGATAMRASVQSPAQFKNGRQLSAWIGITPKEYSSGNQRYLGKISKRGDKYLRTLLIHGARSAMARIKIRQRDKLPLNALQQWAAQLEQRVGHNKATVALANKMVRILWATWMYDRNFDGNYAV